MDEHLAGVVDRVVDVVAFRHFVRGDFVDDFPDYAAELRRMVCGVENLVSGDYSGRNAEIDRAEMDRR